MLVHDAYSTRETWPFECVRCLMIWEEDYTVRHLTGHHGTEVEVWSLAGVRVQPPWSGVCCPACGDTDVKIFPRGYLSRHPELRVTRPSRAAPAADTTAVTAPVAADEPAVTARVPGDEPAVTVPGPVPRRPGWRLVPSPARPRLLYALIGASALLVAGIEVIGLLRAVRPAH
ncbi:hypothetical protein [Sphaerisporangium siamense]|uniref:C2H2-type domain-containing protein n=1 Tax=Sphaerisporangium siamense TaxID=795645 RepID=A0A7W7DA74_9ACTN|nr:hypothetical protein [Sphaerisporangium siamense]MBB4703122.1 hypothetical protein [Sphaerisporangium siamense]